MSHAPPTPSLRRPRPAVLIAAGLALLSLFALAAPAFSVTPGRNGRVAFTSGREGMGDGNAHIFFVNPLKPTLVGPALTPDGLQARHASVSPDRTKMVFAWGTPGSPQTEEYVLLVKDFETGQVNPLDVNLQGNGKSSDHPAFSPDGTKDR